MFPKQATNNNNKGLYCFVAIKVANSISEENGTIVAAVNETVRSVIYAATNIICKLIQFLALI